MHLLLPNWTTSLLIGYLDKSLKIKDLFQNAGTCVMTRYRISPILGEILKKKKSNLKQNLKYFSPTRPGVLLLLLEFIPLPN